jgi:hypothetical protein
MRRFPLISLAGFFFALAIAARAASVTPKVSPLSAHPGETFKLVVTLDNCPADSSLPKLDKDSVDIAGSEITVTLSSKDACSVSFNAAVKDKPLNRELLLKVTSAPEAAGQDRKYLGAFTFRILDVPPIPPGPIPPGIEPQVDVIWDVMSQSTCSDQFGSRLARYYYCIDVMLGNNTGYPLIIAAVGFRRQDGSMDYRESAASYLSTRSVVQTEHVYSARNLTLRGLQAAGLLIGGVSPFFSTAARKGRVAIWSTLVGSTMGTAWDNFIPDRTIRQAGNLDDAALRDGKLIPNNSPVRFAIFVEREAIAPFLARTGTQLQVDAEAAKERADSLTLQAQKETDPIAKKSLTDLAKTWREYVMRLRAEINGRVAKRSAEERLDIARVESLKADLENAPSDRKAAVQRDLEKAQRDSAQSRQALDAELRSTDKKLTRTAKPGPLPSWMQPLARSATSLESNLLSVRRALGTIIIVGDQIEYRQRIQIDSSAVVPGFEPSPEVNTVNGTVVQGKAGDIVLLGKYMAKAKVTALKCNPTFTQQPDPTGNSFTLKAFTVTNCTESAIPLVVDNASSATIYNLPITAKPQLDKPDRGFPIDSKNQVEIAVKGTALTGVKPKLLKLTNPAAGSKDLAESDLKLTQTDAGITISATLPAAFAKADTTGKLTVYTANGGDSDPLEVTFTMAPVLDPPTVRK